MLSHLLAPENAAFLVALVAFLLLGLFQIAGFLLGSGLFAAPDHWGLDADSAGVDVSPGFFDSLMSILGIGKVPIVITFLLFLFSFACVGYNLQLAIHASLGRMLGTWLASIIAFVLSLPMVGVGNQVLAKILPRDETAAVSEASFIGKIFRLSSRTLCFGWESVSSS